MHEVHPAGQLYRDAIPIADAAGAMKHYCCDGHGYILSPAVELDSDYDMI